MRVSSDLKRWQSAQSGRFIVRADNGLFWVRTPSDQDTKHWLCVEAERVSGGTAVSVSHYLTRLIGYQSKIWNSFGLCSVYLGHYGGVQKSACTKLNTSCSVRTMTTSEIILSVRSSVSVCVTLEYFYLNVSPVLGNRNTLPSTVQNECFHLKVKCTGG